MENLYAALGIERNANAGEIVAAYHRLSTMLEEDTSDPAAFPIQSLTKDEYRNLLSNALKTLTDPVARAQYDTAFCTGLPIVMLPSLAIPVITPPQHSFPLPIVHHLNVSLDDLFFGGKKIEFTYQRCLNDRMQERKQSITISPYMRDRMQLCLPECGHHIGGRLGDLLVVLHLDSHQVYTVVGDDLVTDMLIPLSMALLGETVEVRGFDKKRFLIRLTEPFPSRRPLVKCIQGEGMMTPNGRGNLIVNFYVQLPHVPTRFHEEAANLMRLIEKAPAETV